MSDMKYKVLALDLDGTLTNSEKKITDRTKESIFKAMEMGVKVVLASGRPVLGIERLAKELRLDEYGGYILAYNGGQIIEYNTGNIISESTVDMSYYYDICECGHKFDVSVLTYNDEGVISEDETAKYVIKEGYNNTIPVIHVDSLYDSVKKTVVKFMVVGEPEELEKALKYMQGKFDGKLNVFLSEPYFMEVTALGIEKASSLERLLNYLNCTREELMAIGDGLNDIPMLKYAGLAVAMDNAYDETKEHADFITKSNNEDGVAYAVDKFILGE